MTTVFLSGSRTLSRLNDIVRSRLDNMIEKKLSIIVGDANGADKSMQAYLAKCSYENVIVYYVGENYRNNMGGWDAVNVVVDPRLSGRDFYAQKDREMAKLADCGLVLWDGKSAGSVHNMFELLKYKKKAVVYYGPEKEFYNITSPETLEALLKKCDLETFRAVVKKHNIAQSLRELKMDRQPCLDLS